MRKIDLYTKTNQLLVDCAIFAFSFLGSYLIRFEGSPPWDYSTQFLWWLPYLLIARLAVNWWTGVYRSIWRYFSIPDALALARSLALVTAVLVGLRLGYPDDAIFSSRLRIPLSIIALEFLLSLCGCSAVRTLRRMLYQHESSGIRNDEKKRKVLLVGAGRVGMTVAKEMSLNPNFELVCFLDDDPKKAGTLVHGLPVLGPSAALPAVVQQHGIDQIILCMTRPSRETLKKLWAFCDVVPVQMKIVPTLEEILSGRSNISSFRDINLADLLEREMASPAELASEVVEIYRGQRILITGAGGSIGTELAHRLSHASPSELILVDKDENGLNDVFLRAITGPGGPKVHPVVADLRSPERLQAIFSMFRPQIVFHAAAHKHVPLMELNPCEAILNNVVGMRNLVDQSIASGVDRFVLISTDKAVRPRSIMGATKRVCELLLQAQFVNGSTRHSCVRFGNVIGSRGSVIPLFQKQVAQGGPVTITHPDVERFLMTIPEAVDLVLKAGTLGNCGEIFVLDMGDPVPIIRLACDLIELSGLRPMKDIQIEITSLRPGEKLTEQLIDSPAETLRATSSDKISLVEGPPIDRVAFLQGVGSLELAALENSPRRILETLKNLNIGFESISEQAPS
ncbi:MAG: polysaccharide biosynthesis protein [Acidobacteria bacterium]|nr:polysaccharide biosynthesis protein [Acidobacteriota bacterium]